MKILPSKQSNKFQAQSVNPRQGAVASRLKNTQPSWRSSHKLLLAAVGLVAGLSIIGLAYFLVNTKVLIVKNITIDTGIAAQPYQLSVDDIKPHLQPYTNNPMLFISTANIEQQLMQKLPGLQEVYIRKSFPDTLVVEYIPQLAVMQVNAKDKVFLVNGQGKVFAQAQMEGLPTLVSPQDDLAVGQTVSASGIKVALGIIASLRLEDLTIKTIQMDANYISLELSKPPRILVGNAKDPQQVVLIIKDLLSHYQQQNKTPSVIDLRYDRPVVQN